VRKTQRRIDQPVFHLPVFADDDDERLARRHADEFDVLERGVLLLRHDQPRTARKPGEHHRRLRQNVFDAAAGRGDARFDRCPFLVGELAHLEEPIDEEAQAPFGRHAAGACVRGIEEAHRFQVRHDIADRGRRQRNGQALRQRAGAHGLARRQKSVHEMTKDLARPFAQLGSDQSRLVDWRCTHV
jgi:hypothetical protein